MYFVNIKEFSDVCTHPGRKRPVSALIFCTDADRGERHRCVDVLVWTDVRSHLAGWIRVSVCVKRPLVFQTVSALLSGALLPVQIGCHCFNKRETHTSPAICLSVWGWQGSRDPHDPPRPPASIIHASFTRDDWQPRARPGLISPYDHPVNLSFYCISLFCLKFFIVIIFYLSFISVDKNALNSFSLTIITLIVAQKCCFLFLM